MKTNCPNRQTINKPPNGGSRSVNEGELFIENFGRKNPGNKGRPYEKLNYTSVEQVLNSDKVVIGTFNIPASRQLLFDTGATTSLLAQEFAPYYGIICWRKYPCYSHMKQQVIMICLCEYYVELLVISIKDIALVLGVDWLCNHEA
jgi:hypothetical protein